MCLQFRSEVRFINAGNRRQADARSILDLVASDTAFGAQCRLEIKGPDQDRAARKLNDFIKKDFPHADDPLPRAEAIAGPQGGLPHIFKHGHVDFFRGRTLVPGIARARAALLAKTRPWPQRFAAAAKADPKKELRACSRRPAANWNRNLREKSGRRPADPNAAGILRAHLAVVVDANFQGRISALIKKNKMTAGRAISRTVARLTPTLQGLSSPYLRERAGDIHDLAGQLAEKLYPTPTAGTVRHFADQPWLWPPPCPLPSC